MQDKSREEVFRRKVLESHSERLYGSIAEDSSESKSGSSKESSPPQPEPQAVLAESDHDLEKDSEGVSIHEQHERFMEKQIQLATSYKEKQEELPRTISSKRSATKFNEGSCEDFVLGKKAKLSSEVEKDAGIQKGPRTVSRAEKNKRRKLKKKKRLARKS